MNEIILEQKIVNMRSIDENTIIVEISGQDGVKYSPVFDFITNNYEEYALPCISYTKTLDIIRTMRKKSEKLMKVIIAKMKRSYDVNTEYGVKGIEKWLYGIFVEK